MFEAREQFMVFGLSSNLSKYEKNCMQSRVSERERDG